MIWPFYRRKPAKAEKRSPDRVVQRQYNAASIDRLTASWTTQPQTSDEILRRQLRTLRTRSREQARNNDYARRFLALTVSNVVGPKGIALQAQATDPDGTPDTIAQQVIERGWSDWGSPENCSVSGQLSWADQQRLVARTVAQDGEALVEFVRGGPHGVMLKHWDPERLDVDHNRDLGRGRFIRMGIEFSATGRPVAYHLLDGSGEAYQWQTRKYRRVPATQMLHIFLPEFVEQKRGVPWTATALMRMQMLGGYEEAALTNARVGASKMGFFVSPDGDAYVGAGQDATGATVTSADPGTFEQLPTGTDFRPFNPDYPHGEFGDFVKASLRGISSGLGVSYNTLGNDLEGVNYSSIRQGALEDREMWKAVQEWLVDQFCQPVYARWLEFQLMLGRLKVAGRPLREDRYEKYRAVTWQPRRWQWVDPAKEMQAHERAIAQGLRSRSEIIREQGRDPEDVWSEIQREQARMRDLGIEPAAARVTESPREDTTDE